MSTASPKESPHTRPSYKGLFPPSVAPSHRAYCILFSFFFGVLEVTSGAVFYHVISRHPMSGGHSLHTPPLPLALGLIIIGLVTLLVTLWVALRHGFDDGDARFEDDSRNFIKDDVLDRRFQATQETPNV